MAREKVTGDKTKDEKPYCSSKGRYVFLLGGGGGGWVGTFSKLFAKKVMALPLHKYLHKNI